MKPTWILIANASTARCFEKSADGKLNLLGAFDSFFVNEVPAVHPHCAVVLRLRLERAEAGEHTITLHLIDEDGKHVMQPLEGRLRVLGTASPTATISR